MKRNKFLYPVILFISLGIIFSCAIDESYRNKVVQDSFDSLNTLHFYYKSMMESASSLHKKGHLSKPDIEEIKDSGNSFYSAYMDAVDSLERYKKNLESEDIVSKNIEKARSKYMSLEKLVNNKAYKLEE